MRWQDLAISKKLGFVFGSIIILLLGISTLSWVGVKQLSGAIDRTIYFNELGKITLEREIDHMNWQNRLIIFLLSDNTRPLKVKMDHKSCNLGKFLYGEERSEAEKALPQLAQVFKDLEKPHALLHESAREIQQSVKDNDWERDDAFEIYNKKTRSAMQQIKASLHAINDQISVHVEENNEKLQKNAAFKQVMIIAFTSIATIVGLLFSFFISRMISGSLNQAISLASSLAKGDLTARLDLQQKDEFGRLATALNSMADKLNTMISNISNEVVGLSSSSSELNSIAQSMGDSSKTVSEQSTTAADATQEMSNNMNTVAAASEEASTNVNIVATASEEVSSSIGEVDSKTKDARAITEDAVALAGSATGKVDALGDAANKISKVTQVITEISEQTNLLALNATIEAARAGEAGKGFAVVANEIKELASQTSDATGEIRSSIEAMQSSTDATVTEIRQITDVINQVDDIVAAIAISVAEQSSTTTEITENILQAAQGIGEVNENVAHSTATSAEIAENVSKVSDMSLELTTTSKDVENTATDLSQAAERLKAMVDQFKLENRA